MHPSPRDPGVCRDEIAIAIGLHGGHIQTILVESEQEVQPPVNIGHIQWLDMHDWQLVEQHSTTDNGVGQAVLNTKLNRRSNFYLRATAGLRNVCTDTALPF